MHREGDDVDGNTWEGWEMCYQFSVGGWGLGVAAGDERDGASIPPLMIVPLANARFTTIKGGYPNVSLRLML